MPHVEHDYFSSFNQPDHCFLVLSCRCRPCLRAVYTGDFCRGNSMPFLLQQNCIEFQTCSKPLRYRGDKSHWKLHLVYTCDFEVATLARQKLHRVAATKIACVNEPLSSLLSWKKGPEWLAFAAVSHLTSLTIRGVPSQATEYYQHIIDVQFSHDLIRPVLARRHRLKSQKKKKLTFSGRNDKCSHKQLSLSIGWNDHFHFLADRPVLRNAKLPKTCDCCRLSKQRSHSNRHQDSISKIEVRECRL